MSNETIEQHEGQKPVSRRKRTSGSKKEVALVIGLAATIFILSVGGLGAVVYSIKKNYPTYSKNEARKIQDMSYNEAVSKGYPGR